METISKNTIEKLNDIERQQLLYSCIPMLENFDSKSGNEGTVFFVSKDIIVKKYFSKIDQPQVLHGMYNEYCKECVNYRRKGYNIPMIYSWTISLRPDHSGFDYYLLEERIPGRELFLSNMNKLYNEYCDDVSDEEFNNAIEKPNENISLYKKIVHNYIHDFIEMNKRINSMSDNELQSFLEGVYKMFNECRYAIPDVHARNVLMHQQKLNLIDLYLEKDEFGYRALHATPAENLLLARIIALFDYNGLVMNLKKDEKLLQFESEINLNEVLCTESIKKFIRASKKICEFSPKKDWWEGLVKRLQTILSKDKMVEVIKEADIKVKD